MALNTLQIFTAFYDGWLIRRHHLQQQLSQIQHVKQPQLDKLVEQAADHYRQYYQQKASAMEDDVFLICSLPWYTSFEQALFWVTGFPPSLLFRFTGELDLTAVQAEWVETVREETVAKEKEIGDAMAMVQESMAAAPLYGLVNRPESLVDGEVSELDEAMEELKEAMRAVVAEADGLRAVTVMEILKVLGVVQRIKFFAAVGEFRIRVRRVGLDMDRATGGIL
ncbi:protein RESPONSE TO ABA AND SALT 1-like [Bidens hawaiensis]|uniref:protein RESPONSE TO ABA AND SALT 1-like n=1 Tax=Bidens hawaiensis TaxID=980011 RepID=UPI00404A7E4F